MLPLPPPSPSCAAIASASASAKARVNIVDTVLPWHTAIDPVALTWVWSWFRGAGFDLNLEHHFHTELPLKELGMDVDLVQLSSIAELVATIVLSKRCSEANCSRDHR